MGSPVRRGQAWGEAGSDVAVHRTSESCFSSDPLSRRGLGTGNWKHRVPARHRHTALISVCLGSEEQSTSAKSSYSTRQEQRGGVYVCMVGARGDTMDVDLALPRRKRVLRMTTSETVTVECPLGHVRRRINGRSQSTIPSADGTRVASIISKGLMLLVGRCSVIKVCWE
jgi:hypothetical protein